MEFPSTDIIGPTPTEHMAHIAQAVARIHLQRELTANELAEVLDAVPAAAHSAEPRTSWTPPELAREWGVSPDKILNWIRSGELPATNMATHRSGRPRYRIDADGISAFRSKRAVVSPPPRQTRRRQTSPDVIEFF